MRIVSVGLVKSSLSELLSFVNSFINNIPNTTLPTSNTDSVTPTQLNSNESLVQDPSKNTIERHPHTKTVNENSNNLDMRTSE